MTFQINFYPEFAKRRTEARRRALFMAGASALLALEVGLVVWIGLNGMLLKDQASRLEADLARLSARVENAGTQEPEQESQNWSAFARRDRMDWAPVLSALSCLMDKSLMLNELRGEVAGRGSAGKLEIEGRLLNRDSDGDAVAGLVERIRSEPRIFGAFPSITLGRLEGGGSGQFNIVCEPEKSGS